MSLGDENTRRSQERCKAPLADAEDRIAPRGTNGARTAMVTLVRCLARQAAREAWEQGNPDSGYPTDAPKE